MLYIDSNIVRELKGSAFDEFLINFINAYCDDVMQVFIDFCKSYDLNNEDCISLLCAAQNKGLVILAPSICEYCD